MENHGFCGFAQVQAGESCACLQIWAGVGSGIPAGRATSVLGSRFLRLVVSLTPGSRVLATGGGLRGVCETGSTCRRLRSLAGETAGPSPVFLPRRGLDFQRTDLGGGRDVLLPPQGSAGRGLTLQGTGLHPGPHSVGSQSREQKHGPPTPRVLRQHRCVSIPWAPRAGPEGVSGGVNPARMSSAATPWTEAEGPGRAWPVFLAVWLGRVSSPAEPQSSHLSNGPV